jgi:hypothetical protein
MLSVLTGAEILAVIAAGMVLFLIAYYIRKG